MGKFTSTELKLLKVARERAAVGSRLCTPTGHQGAPGIPIFKEICDTLDHVIKLLENEPD